MRMGNGSRKRKRTRDGEMTTREVQLSIIYDDFAFSFISPSIFYRCHFYSFTVCMDAITRHLNDDHPGPLTALPS